MANKKERATEEYWSKEKEGGKVWWLKSYPPMLGVMEFSFDQKKTYNLFRDYPHELTKEEKEIFDNENPFWADFFRGRSE